MRDQIAGHRDDSHGRRAVRAAVHDGVLQHVAEDRVEGARIGERRRPLRRRRGSAPASPRASRASAGAHVDPLPQQPAVGLRDEERVLELNLQPDGVVQQAIERRACAASGQSSRRPSACSWMLARDGLQVVGERHEERLERLRAGGARGEWPARIARPPATSSVMNVAPSHRNMRWRLVSVRPRLSHHDASDTVKTSQTTASDVVQRAYVAAGERHVSPPLLPRRRRAPAAVRSELVVVRQREEAHLVGRRRQVDAACQGRVEEARDTRRRAPRESVGPPDLAASRSGAARRSTRGVRRRGPAARAERDPSRSVDERRRPRSSAAQPSAGFHPVERGEARPHAHGIGAQRARLVDGAGGRDERHQIRAGPPYAPTGKPPPMILP